MAARPTADTQDFGDQWTAFTTLVGYHASAEWTQDMLGELLSLKDIRGHVGRPRSAAGSGRFTNILLDCGVSKVVAVEPSRRHRDAKQRRAIAPAAWPTSTARARRCPPTPPRLLLAFRSACCTTSPIRRRSSLLRFSALKPGGRMLGLALRPRGQRQLSALGRAAAQDHDAPAALGAAGAVPGPAVGDGHLRAAVPRAAAADARTTCSTPSRASPASGGAW